MENISRGPYTLPCVRYVEAVSDPATEAAPRGHRHRSRRSWRGRLCPRRHASLNALWSSNKIELAVPAKINHEYLGPPIRKKECQRQAAHRSGRAQLRPRSEE